MHRPQLRSSSSGGAGGRDGRKEGRRDELLGPVLVEDDEFDEDEDEEASNESGGGSSVNGKKGARRRAPYAEMIRKSFFQARRGVLECVLLVQFAGDKVETTLIESLTEKIALSSSTLVIWPSDTKFDLPLHITVTLRTASATADLTTAVFSSLTGQVWDLKLEVERITGVPPSRQCLEYQGGRGRSVSASSPDCMSYRRPVEDYFGDIIDVRDPSSPYGFIDGVLLRDIIERDPNNEKEGIGGMDGHGQDDEAGNGCSRWADPELWSCCAEMPYRVFVRFSEASPSPPSVALQRRQQQHIHVGTHAATGKGTNIGRQNQSLLKHQQRHRLHCSKQQNNATQSVHMKSKNIRRRKKQQRVVDVIELGESDDVDDSSKEEVRNGSCSNNDKSNKKEEDSRGRDTTSREDSDAKRNSDPMAKPPDPKRHRHIKIKNINNTMKKNGKPNLCGRICSQSSTNKPVTSQIEGNNKDCATIKRSHASMAKCSSDSKVRAVPGPTSSSRSHSWRGTTTKNNDHRANWAAAGPTPVPSSREGRTIKHHSSGPLPLPSLPSSSSSSGVASSTTFRAHPPFHRHAHPPPNNDVHSWLCSLDSENGATRNGRILRHVASFMREFPCLRDVTIACEMEGPDRVLDACGVTAMGERACLKRAMRELTMARRR